MVSETPRNFILSPAGCSDAWKPKARMKKTKWIVVMLSISRCSANGSPEIGKAAKRNTETFVVVKGSSWTRIPKKRNHGNCKTWQRICIQVFDHQIASDERPKWIGNHKWCVSLEQKKTEKKLKYSMRRQRQPLPFAICVRITFMCSFRVYSTCIHLSLSIINYGTAAFYLRWNAVCSPSYRRRLCVSLFNFATLIHSNHLHSSFSTTSTLDAFSSFDLKFFPHNFQPKSLHLIYTSTRKWCDTFNPNKQ